MTHEDPDHAEFLAWLREQDADMLDDDILSYGTPTMTAIMTTTSSAVSPTTHLHVTETAIVSAYPDAKLVTVTFPRVIIDAATRAWLPGVIRELPVPSRSAERPDPTGEIFSREVGILIHSGWAAVTDNENAQEER
jgi:hypothetical protein